MVNGFIKAINLVIYGINLVNPGKDIDPLGEIKLGRIPEPVELADLGTNGSVRALEPRMTININAGLVSTPDQVGQQIIESIQKAERRSGPVFARAS
jgi:hypothetical protein